MPTQNVYFTDEEYTQLAYATLKLNESINDVIKRVKTEGFKALAKLLEEEKCKQ
jgi:Txe/YoeB family toxin of Txe-Axe toxin-antitoxin module